MSDLNNDSLALIVLTQMFFEHRKRGFGQMTTRSAMGRAAMEAAAEARQTLADTKEWQRSRLLSEEG